MQIFLKILLIILLTFGLNSCSDSVTGSKNTVATFFLKLSESTSAQVSDGMFTFTDLGGTTFIITEAKTNVRHIQFDLPEGEFDSTNQISLNGPFIIDLMTGASNPKIGAFDVQPGVYKRIDVRLDDTKANDGLVTANDELMDNTMVVKGTFDYDGNENRNFTFILKFNEDVRFEEPGGISVADGATKDIVINLKVNEWLKNINITKCLDDGDVVLESNGALLINDQNSYGDCSNFEQTIKTNIKNNYDFSD